MNSLRPTSVCDTTPLQRLESQSSSSEEASSANFNGLCTNIPARITLIASANSGTTKTTAASTATAFQSVNAPVTTTALTANATATNTATTTTVTLVPIKHLNNNNNKIEISFNHLIAGKANEKTKMHLLGARQIFTRIVLDLLLLSCVALPVLSFNLWGEPFKRGFFCDDESLKHPYHESTIQSWMLYLVCLVIPILLIIAVEFFKANSNKMHGFDQLSSERYYICHMEIPSWIIECYKKIGILIFGCGVEQLTTEIAKFSIGRLRPHFFAVCQPIMYDGTTCNDPINAQRYIEDYACLGVDVTTKMLKEVSLSFPSGHASFSFFTMIYIAVYLQKRMTWKRAKLCRHFLQFLFLMFAWYTTLTRVSDYKHHWTDVIAGSTIGIVYALIVTSSMW